MQPLGKGAKSLYIWSRSRDHDDRHVLLSFDKRWSWLDLDFSMARPNLVPLTFEWIKIKKLHFSAAIVLCDINKTFKFNLYEIQEVKVIW